MPSYNRVALLGNVTRDPELRQTANGLSVCDLGLAVNDKRKNASGEWVEDTCFVDCTCWGRTAEIAAEYLAKGSPAMVEGRLKLDQWTDRDGQKRSKLKVIAERLVLLGSGGSGSGNSGRSQRTETAQRSGQTQRPRNDPPQHDTAAPAQREAAVDDIPEDDIPF